MLRLKGSAPLIALSAPFCRSTGSIMQTEGTHVVDTLSVTLARPLCKSQSADRGQQWGRKLRKE